jgi:hypothetical protein
MIQLVPYTLILLGISAVAMGFIFRVIKKQLGLFKKPLSERDIKHFRYTLFAISIVIVVMGLIPIIINVVTVFIEVGGNGNSGRPTTVSLISFIYSLGVHLQTLLLSYLLWRIYRLANGDNDS